MKAIKKRLILQILDVVEIGETVESSEISRRINEQYGEKPSSQSIGVNIKWRLGHRFTKEGRPEKSFLFTRVH